jgi:Stigma-specific protein, Stig1
MSQHWDEFSKSLAEETVPRRESLRRLGAVFAGAVLGPLGLQTASAGHRQRTGQRLQDPCKAFCTCRNSRQKNACLTVCRACNNDPSRMCGGCGTYTCCGNGQACCGDYCADLEGDVYNCGACGNVCEQPGPWEYGTCMFGECFYACAEGAVYCDGACTFLDWDADNCGGCGNVCPASAPYCDHGVCSEGGCAPGLTRCGDQCVDLMWDANNCGACGWQCAPLDYCAFGVCEGYCYGCE